MKIRDLLSLPIKVKPKIYKVSGPNGKPPAIMGAVARAIREAGRELFVSGQHIEELIDEYMDRAANANDYANLLKISKEYVDFKFVK